MNLTGWAQAHKPQAAVGALAGVGGLALYMKHRAAATGSAPSGGAAPSSSPALQSAGFSSAPLDQYNQLAGAISNLNDQVSLLQAGSTPAATGAIPAAPSGQGTWLANPLGSQPGGASEANAFLGTESYQGAYYNVYNLGALQADAPGGMNWLQTLYPGQQPSKVWASGNVAISPTGTQVAVPVFSGAGALPGGGFIPKGSLTP